MNVQLLGSAPFGESADLLAIAWTEGASDPPEGLPDALAEALSGAVAAGDLRGKTGEQVLLYGSGEDGPRRLLAVGVGPEAELDLEAVRRFGGRAVRAAESARVTHVTVAVPATDSIDPELALQAVSEGLVMAAWRFTELKAAGDDPPVQVDRASVWAGPAASTSAVAAGVAGARGENLARELQTYPGNRMTPTILAGRASQMAERAGLEIDVWGRDRLLAEKMHALLSVSHGSVEEPKLIVLTHSGGQAGDPPVVLVGKGLTFDAGGYSLKPPAGMEDMKYDMSGGAAVIGAMQAIAEMGLPINVVGVVPSSENLISGAATKPGDVIDSRAGKSIEVINTDAEGRLILADALAYAATLDPAAVVDCATLTGAVVIGLGHHAMAVLGNNDGLVDELKSAGETSGERVWPLPLWKEYRKQLDSEVADLKNVGGRPAGTITAAAFLKEFVGDVTWAHLDIAGTAYGDEPAPYRRKGAYGVPTRLLFEWVRGRAG